MKQVMARIVLALLSIIVFGAVLVSGIDLLGPIWGPLAILAMLGVVVLFFWAIDNFDG